MVDGLANTPAGTNIGNAIIALQKHIKRCFVALGFVTSVLLSGASGYAQTPGGTTITNEARANFQYRLGQRDSVRSNVAETVVSPLYTTNLEITKYANASYVTPTHLLQYTLRYRNTGSATATGVSVVDTLPAQVNFISASNGAQYTWPSVRWNPGSVLPGGVDSISITVSVRGDLAASDTVILNRAWLASDNAPRVADSVVVIIRPEVTPNSPRLALSKSVDKPITLPASQLTYTLNLTNSGTGTALSAVVADTIPANTIFVSATQGGTLQGQVVEWNIDSLGAGQARILQLMVQVTPGFNNGYVNNSAVAYAQNAQSVATPLVRTIVTDARASSIALKATPKAIVGNGDDVSLVQAVAFDERGNPVPDGSTIFFTTSHGVFSNGSGAQSVATSTGVAVASLRSQTVNGNIVMATVEGAAMNSLGDMISGVVNVPFYPGGVRGSVVRAADGQPVADVVAIAFSQGGGEAGRDTTDERGEYIIPLRSSGVHTVSLIYRNEYGDAILTSTKTGVTIPASGGVPAVTPLNAITGNVIAYETAKPIREDGITVTIDRLDLGKTAVGRSIPAQQVTDLRGVFVFDSLAPGSYVIRVSDTQYSGSAIVHITGLGSLVTGANVRLAVRPTFELVKSANKRITEIGDQVSYTIEVRNTSTVSLRGLRLLDDLPHGFVYASRSTRLNGVALTEPTGARRLEWHLPDTLLTGQRTALTYSVAVGAGSLAGDGMNRAYGIAITAAGDTIRTDVSSVKVIVRPGVFTERGIVIGKVFYDHNRNGSQDEGEEGIPGVELWMEDGTRIVTGDDGKYSLPEVKPGQHVIRINQLTLPTGSRLLSTGSDFAGDGKSRFIRLPEGGIERADFHVLAPNQAAMQSMFSVDKVPKVGEKIQAVYIIQWNKIGRATAVFIRDTLRHGYYYDLSSASMNSVPLRTEKKQSRVLKLDIPPGQPGTIDTIRFSIVADSIGIGRTNQSRASLVLSYARRRDAVFEARRVPYPASLEPVFARSVAPVEQRVEIFTPKTDTPKPVGQQVRVESVSLPITKAEEHGQTQSLKTPDQVSGIQPEVLAWGEYVIRQVAGKGFEIQVSSWQTTGKAYQEVGRLKGKGHPAFVERDVDQNGRVLHRVKVGFFGSIDEAKAQAATFTSTADKIPADTDMPGYIIRPVSGKGFDVQFSAWRQRENAERKKEQLLVMGFPAFVETYEDQSGGLWYRVKAGYYASAQEAREQASIIGSAMAELRPLEERPLFVAKVAAMDEVSLPVGLEKPPRVEVHPIQREGSAVIRYVEGTGFAIQVSAWRTRQAAEQHAEEFRMVGQQVQIQQHTDDRLRRWYRVLVGAYRTHDEAARHSKLINTTDSASANLRSTSGGVKG